MPQIKPRISGPPRHPFSLKISLIRVFLPSRMFYPHLPAIVNHGSPANDPEITRNTFLTYVRKN
ncbi:TPA: hypothetical protein JD264_18580 [Serratia fonticola]|nr:hypothetical protein [Serratia fonticola]